jgi:hypothetical protein
MYTLTLTTDYATETWAATEIGDMLALGYTIARTVDAVNSATGNLCSGFASINVTTGPNKTVIIMAHNRGNDGLLAAFRNTPIARAEQDARAVRMRRLRDEIAAAAAAEGCTQV